MPKILLIEDNPINSTMLRRRLERKGFEVYLAVDGPDGIAAARAQSPDLILMDISLGLGKMDGWEATQKIKADPATAGIPIMALTAHAMESDRLKSVEVGCSDFDTKPVDFNRLLTKISALLEGAQRVA
ncbi:MAG TPA: response regulator [Burkholderiales bacterium]|nr:response regulator [Burkholderiales bacterium]